MEHQRQAHCIGQRGAGLAGPVKQPVEPRRRDPVGYQQQAMIEAPQNKVPGRAVPEAANYHGEHQVTVGARHPAAVAPQGYI